MSVERNDEARDTEGPRVIRSRGDGSVGVMDRGVAIGLLQAGSAEAAMIAQRERCVGRRIIGFDFKRLVQKRYRYCRVICKVAVRKWSRTQDEVVCFQTVRTATSCSVKLRMA